MEALKFILLVIVIELGVDSIVAHLHTARPTDKPPGPRTSHQNAAIAQYDVGPAPASIPTSQ